MSQYDDDEGDDSSNEGNGISSLRGAKKKADKRIKELEAELETLRVQTRARVVKDAIQAKGLNPKIAGLLPQNLGTDEASLDAWLEEYGDLFGKAPEKPADDKSPAGTQTPGTVPPDAAASQRISAAQAQGRPADVGDLDLLANQIAQAKTPEELSALLFGTPASTRSPL